MKFEFDNVSKFHINFISILLNNRLLLLSLNTRRKKSFHQNYVVNIKLKNLALSISITNDTNTAWKDELIV